MIVEKKKREEDLARRRRLLCRVEGRSSRTNAAKASFPLAWLRSFSEALSCCRHSLARSSDGWRRVAWHPNKVVASSSVISQIYQEVVSSASTVTVLSDGDLSGLKLLRHRKTPAWQGRRDCRASTKGRSGGNRFILRRGCRLKSSTQNSQHMHRKRSRVIVTTNKALKKDQPLPYKEPKLLIPPQSLLRYRLLFIMALALRLSVSLDGFLVTVHWMYLAVDGILGVAKVEVAGAKGSDEGNKG